MSKQLEERVAFLEAEVARLSQQVQSSSSSEPWWKKRAGMFADDPGYNEAMRLGREYRDAESLSWGSEDPKDQEIASTPAPAESDAEVFASRSKEPLSKGADVHS